MGVVGVIYDGGRTELERLGGDGEELYEGRRGWGGGFGELKGY